MSKCIILTDIHTRRLWHAPRDVLIILLYNNIFSFVLGAGDYNNNNKNKKKIGCYLIIIILVQHHHPHLVPCKILAYYVITTYYVINNTTIIYRWYWHLKYFLFYRTTVNLLPVCLWKVNAPSYTCELISALPFFILRFVICVFLVLEKSFSGRRKTLNNCD